jgi:hypothetical protein
VADARKADSFPGFGSFKEWRAFILQFSLPTVPLTVAAKFESAQKLYVLAWVDFDLIKAGELMALTALELAVTDRYAGKEMARRRETAVKKAAQANGTISNREQRRIENVSFADLLKYMVDHDGLTDEQIALNRRCGPPSKVLGLLTGETRPSLAEMRNELAHGAPFGGFPRAGLLELVRDLVAYAYRGC